MNAAESLAYLSAIYAMPSADQSKANVLAIAGAADPPLPSTSFVAGDPTERLVEVLGRALNAWNAIPAAAVRGAFFALATDPGDVDDYGNPDTSADQTPRPGWLSALGAGLYGTERGGQTYATATVTITNSGAAASLPFRAGDLTFEYSAATRDDGGTPTYTSTADASVYTGIGSTLTLAAGASVTLPVQAVQIGTYGSAPANAIDTCVTGSVGTFTVTASAAAIGTEREARGDYIARCLDAPAANAPGGPGAAYRRAATTSRTGEPLQRHDGSGTVGIVAARVQVVTDSATGEVTCYFADKDGGADAVDVASANANIEGVILGVITDPTGVVPDTVTYTGSAATNTTVAVTYSAKARASSIPGASAGTYTSGGSPPAVVAAVFTAIADSIAAYLSSVPGGGLDQVAGAGYVYTSEIQDAISDARTGLYALAVTLPASSSTSIAVGHVPAPGTISGTLVLV